MLNNTGAWGVALHAQPSTALPFHTMFKTTRHRAPRVDIPHRKPLGTAKATDPKELLMVLAPSVGGSKGHYKEFES